MKSKDPVFKFKAVSFCLLTLVLVTFFFLFFLPLLVNSCSQLFTDKSLNLFDFSKHFSVIFVFIEDANIWFNGLIAAGAGLYIIFLIYFIFYLIFFLSSKRIEITFIAYLICLTIVAVFCLLMLSWSIINILYYLKVMDAPLILIVLTLIPGINFFTSIYWLVQILLNFWAVVFLVINIFWMIFIICFIAFMYVELEDKDWDFFVEEEFENKIEEVDNEVELKENQNLLE